MRQALSFLTPMGGARAPTPRALAWFPVVGAVIGALLGLVWWASSKAWPAGVVATIVVAADLAVTGMLHFDGLLDSADGLLPHLTRDRRLEVMRDSSVGAFAMAAGAVVILLRWSAIAGMKPSLLLLIGIWVISRAAMGVCAVVMPYARPDGGIASSFLAGPGAKSAGAVGGVVGLAGGLACLLAWRVGPGLAVVGAQLFAALVVAAFAKHRIGGFTGDVLGAMGIISETVALAVAAAKW